jgi:small multidrug resistance pump
MGGLSMSTSKNFPVSLKRWLLAAALYNAVFGLYTLVWPRHYFQWAGLGSEAPYPEALWPCIGMIVAVYGLGYAIAALDPLRHWPIVLVGFLGKVLGPLGFVDAVLRGLLPAKFGWILLANDLVWWPSFAAILVLAARHHGFSQIRLKEAVREISTLVGFSKRR